MTDRAVVVAIAFVLGCGGGAGDAARDAAEDARFGDASAPRVPPQGVAGDTIAAPTDGPISLGWDHVAAIAVWVGPGQIARAAVVDPAAHQIGATLTFATTNVVAAHALALGGTHLAVALVTSEPKYYVALVGDDGVASTPVALVAPSSSCDVVVPDKLLCTTADAHQLLGTIDPTGAVAFGPPATLTASAVGARSSGEALLFVDAAGCGTIAAIASDDTIGSARPIGCPSASTITSATTAFEPKPANDSVFARAYVNAELDATHRECTFYAMDAALTPTVTAHYTDGSCPQALAFGGGQALGITVTPAGGATFTVFVLGGAIPSPSPIFGIGGLRTVGITGTDGGVLGAISDGVRLQFIWGPQGIPI